MNHYVAPIVFFERDLSYFVHKVIDKVQTDFEVYDLREMRYKKKKLSSDIRMTTCFVLDKILQSHRKVLSDIFGYSGHTGIYHSIKTVDRYLSGGEEVYLMYYQRILQATIDVWNEEKKHMNKIIVFKKQTAILRPIKKKNDYVKFLKPEPKINRPPAIYTNIKSSYYDSY